MQITKLRLKNFRCFQDFELEFDKKAVLIQGNNGSGKTSLLEALFYACYLRSFRTRLGKELLNFTQDHFFLQVDFSSEAQGDNQIQIGFSNLDGKLIKFNQKPVKSFKDLISNYKVISISEDDLNLVSGQPDFRRSFLNQSIFLVDQNFVTSFRKYGQILEHRNSFLAKKCGLQKLDKAAMDELYAWTKQLWEQSSELQKKYVELLNKIELKVEIFLQKYFRDKISINLFYQYKTLPLQNSYDEFWISYTKNCLERELKWGRSLFGIHLDDFSINFQKNKARYFASRGEQKLVLFLLKIAQFLEIEKGEQTGCILLDDFLTDFDKSRITAMAQLLASLNCQFFFTSPIKNKTLTSWQNFFDSQIIDLHRSGQYK